MIVSRPRPGNAQGPGPAVLRAVRVGVPGRLHVGFLDLHGGLGRRFGSLGIALDEPSTRVRVEPAPGLAADGPDADRARAALARVVDRLGLAPRVRVVVESAIPAHVGLGSGTQLALAVGVAVARLHALELDARSIAGLLERGARSGLGLATFEAGGVVLDGGRGEAAGPPPVLARLPFPEEWRILLVSDRSRRGLHGAHEAAALDGLPPFPAETAAHLCRLVLMAALPALAERDLARFGAALGELQRRLGDHFAPVQGGRLASPAVARVLSWLEREGVAGVGQSSWGPTGFAVVGSEGEARRLWAAARRGAAASGVDVAIARGRNRGGRVEVVDAPPSPDPHEERHARP